MQLKVKFNVTMWTWKIRSHLRAFKIGADTRVFFKVSWAF